MPADYFIRAMREEDVADVEQLTDEAFYAEDVARRRVDDPEPSRRAPARAEAWRLRLAHMLAHDPAGCFVAEDRGGLIGAVASLKRDLTWVLATFAVRPDVQGRGVGTQLFEAASAYGRGCLRAMVSGSEHPGAVRRYRLAGFSLHPMLYLRGPVPRAALPVVERVRDGSAADIDLMNSVDRQVRDAAHGVDHTLMTKTHRLVVVDRATGSGYAYLEDGGGPYLLAATNRRTATDLLWETLAATSPDAPAAVGHVTAVNEWAVDVGMAARMELRTHGYLALRHLKPPVPYLPSGHFL
ncbi:MAG: GNAT family N-acetyltransferase [Nocardioidaceae bacterium]